MKGYYIKKYIASNVLLKKIKKNTTLSPNKRNSLHVKAYELSFHACIAV